jgi:thiosulfate dehydrogenase
MTTFKQWTLFACLAMVITLSLHQLVPPAEAGDTGQLVRGAQLYDNWPKLAGAELEGSHPLYPAEGKKSGKSSWRCKECHGWDYIGKDGRYAKGSHYTGIAGTIDVRGQGLETIRTALTNSAGQHDFSSWLKAQDIEALSVFLQGGQTDIGQALNSDGQPNGESALGQAHYQSNCASCHGADGNALDFKSKKDGAQGVGYLANKNPQETWHKILWGHPGSDMPSMWAAGLTLTLTETANLLAYCQTLP